MPAISGIYIITNTTNDKIYIGSSVNMYSRWKRHIKDLNNNKHHSKYLQNSWFKYGEENFTFEIIEQCERSKLIEREQVWLDFFKPEYNSCKIAGSCLGFKHSEETKMKKRGRPAWNKGIKTGRAWGASVKGKPWSEARRNAQNLKKEVKCVQQ